MPKILKSEIIGKRSLVTLCLVLVMSLALSVSSVYSEVFVQRMINGITKTGSANVTHSFNIYLTFGLSLLIGRTIFTAFSYRVFLKMSHRIRKAYLKLISFGNEVVDGEMLQTGDLNDRLTKDIDHCRVFCEQTLIPVWSDVVQVVTIISILLYQSLFIGAMFTMYILISIVVLKYFNTKGNEIIPALRNKEAQTSNYLQDVFVNYNDVVPMNVSNRVISWFNKQYDKLLPLKLHAQSFIYRSWIAALVLIAFLEIASLALGGYFFLQGIIGLGTVYMMIDYSNRIQSPLENLQFHSNNFQYLKGALSNLLEVENRFKGTNADGIYPTKPTIHVHINNLKNFNHQVLKKADMVIAPGQIIGLSGVSGSGKSTLAKAIVGLHWQYGGYINYANVPISKISSTAVGENVSYVSVDQALFHASVEHNLQGFAPLAGQETIRERLARLRVPMSVLDYLRITLSKQVGPEGENIDKIADGDRQLLLILRTLLEEKDFIIMDETLSSLDNERFSDISNLLRFYATSHKAKVIVISHKSDRLLFADHVYSIADGEITYFSQLADWESVYEGTTTC